MRVTTWPNERVVTLETLRQEFPPERFRIAEHHYPPGTAFTGRTKSVTWYILSGACRVKTEREVAAQAGDIIEFDATEYALRVIGDRELHVVQVWDVAPLMN